MDPVEFQLKLMMYEEMAKQNEEVKVKNGGLRERNRVLGRNLKLDKLRKRYKHTKDRAFSKRKGKVLGSRSERIYGGKANGEQAVSKAADGE